MRITPTLSGHELQAVQETICTMHVFGQQKLLWRERKDPALSFPLGIKAPGVTLVLCNDVWGGVAWPGPEQEGGVLVPQTPERQGTMFSDLPLLSSPQAWCFVLCYLNFLLLLALVSLSRSSACWGFLQTSQAWGRKHWWEKWRKKGVLQRCCLLNVLRKHPKSDKSIYSINCSGHPMYYSLPQRVELLLFCSCFTENMVFSMPNWIWENLG